MWWWFMLVTFDENNGWFWFNLRDEWLKIHPRKLKHTCTLKLLVSLNNEHKCFYKKCPMIIILITTFDIVKILLPIDTLMNMNPRKIISWEIQTSTPALIKQTNWMGFRFTTRFLLTFNLKKIPVSKLNHPTCQSCH